MFYHLLVHMARPEPTPSGLEIVLEPLAAEDLADTTPLSAHAPVLISATAEAEAPGLAAGAARLGARHLGRPEATGHMPL